MELGDIKGVGSVTEERLKEAGITSIAELAKSDPEDISENSSMSASTAKKLVLRAKEQGILIQTGGDVVDEYESKRIITTGMDVLDDILDGGWREGDIVALSGGSGSGKTQIGFHSCIRAVEATGEPAVYIETEPGRYSPKRLRQLVSDKEQAKEIQEKVYRVQAYDLEQQKLAYKKITQGMESCSLVVVDSFSANFRGSDEFEDRSTLNNRATETKNHFKLMREMGETLGCPVLITAQIYGDPSGWGSGEATYGGSVFDHTINYKIHLRDGQGSFTEAKITNHPEVPETELHINIGSNQLEAMREV